MNRSSSGKSCGIEREEVAGLVFEAVVAGEKDDSGRVVGFDDGIGDHDLELADAAALAGDRVGGGFEGGCHVEQIQDIG